MKKSTVNFIINAVLYLCMAAIAGIGFLIKYVLLPGSERWEKYGQNVELSVWGMDRHEWAYIHLIIGFIILVLLVLHIVLHWSMVICVYHKLFKKKAIYKVLSIAFIALGIIIMVVPFFMEAQIEEHGEGRNEKQGVRREIERKEKKNTNKNLVSNKAKETKELKNQAQQEDHQKEMKEEHSISSLDIRGYMTLSEVSKKYNISTEILKSELGIPKATSNKEKLGKLKKSYDFKMSDIEKIINKHQ